jgi:hypothetical protein
MIHFSHIVFKAYVRILTENNQEVESFQIKNQEFANFNVPLEKGNYLVKIVEGKEEIIKSIIVN